MYIAMFNVPMKKERARMHHSCLSTQSFVPYLFSHVDDRSSEPLLHLSLMILIAVMKMNRRLQHHLWLSDHHPLLLATV
jgi:hypothetical protein